MPADEEKRFISYKDVLEWVEDFEFTHRLVIAWVLTLTRRRGTGHIIQEIRAIARRKNDKGAFEVVFQAYKAFGSGSDHSTLPGAMIACIHELDALMQEKEGRRLEEDPTAGRNPYA